MTEEQTIAAIIEPAIWKDFVGEDAEGPYLIAGKCARCGLVTLGVRKICPECWQEGTMRAVKAGRRGILYSFTVLHQMAAGFEVPAAVGYVDLDSGVRVFAHLDNEPSTLRVGSQLALTLAPLRAGPDGKQLIGPRYRAAAEEAQP